MQYSEWELYDNHLHHGQFNIKQYNKINKIMHAFISHIVLYFLMNLDELSANLWIGNVLVIGGCKWYTWWLLGVFFIIILVCLVCFAVLRPTCKNMLRIEVSENTIRHNNVLWVFINESNESNTDTIMHCDFVSLLYNNEVTLERGKFCTQTFMVYINTNNGFMLAKKKHL